MKISEINPYIRYARFNESNILCEYMSAPDCRIFYCMNGEAVLNVGEKTFSLKKGSFILWRGGTPYRMISKSNTLNMLGVNFDFTYKYENLHHIIQPQLISNYGLMTPIEDMVFPDAEKLNSCLFIENMFMVEDKLIEIVNEYNNMFLYYEERCSSLLKDVIVTAVRNNEFSHIPKNVELAESILAYIRENHMNKINNSDIAAHFSYHPNHINHIVVKYTGMSLHRYLIQHRIITAKYYLTNTKMTVSEIAEKVGMPDLKHFSKCFKKITKHTPSEYRV